VDCDCKLTDVCIAWASSSGAAPPSPTLGFYAGNGGAGSGVLLDTSSDWGSSAAMATETCFLQVRSWIARSFTLQQVDTFHL
jgi:hypothetical protein